MILFGKSKGFFEEAPVHNMSQIIWAIIIFVLGAYVGPHLIQKVDHNFKPLGYN
jgi:hypothetical protein